MFRHELILQDVVVPGSTDRVPAAVGECVTLDEVKEYIHVTYDDDNNTILRLLTAAREWVEQQTKRSIIKQTVKCRVELHSSLELPYGPLYGADPVVAITPEGGRICVGVGPFPRLEGTGTYDLQYEAGQDADKVPEGLKLAILARVAATYENRGDQDKTNYAQVALDHLAPFKRIVAWL